MNAKNLKVKSIVAKALTKYNLCEHYHRVGQHAKLYLVSPSH